MTTLSTPSPHPLANTPPHSIPIPCSPPYPLLCTCSIPMPPRLITILYPIESPLTHPVSSPHSPPYLPSTISSGGSRISPRRGRQLPGGGGANLWFCQISPKTAWKWRNFSFRGGASPAPPLRSATDIPALSLPYLVPASLYLSVMCPPLRMLSSMNLVFSVFGRLNLSNYFGILHSGI